MRGFRGDSVDWPNGLFLTGTLLVALFGVPLFLLGRGLDGFQAGLFLAFFLVTGLSITVGYHRLFSHLTFKARWPVRVFALVFGAAAFENSVLRWAADHRQHHKFVDHDEDPYNISKGFFHAHIGWILFRNAPPISFEGVKDLQQDPLVRWQHRYYIWIALLAGFGLPALMGGLWSGWSGALGAFLLAGVARVVLVHHFTFFINSWSHTWGRRPYSSRCTARDNPVLAWLTFGEGYHNFHHAFQHDYRNGVKLWQFDPAKWCIWLLTAVGLASDLRRVPEETILLAEVAERQRLLASKLKQASRPLAESIQGVLQAKQEQLHQAAERWKQCRARYSHAVEQRLEASRERAAEIRREYREASRRLRAAIREWQLTTNLIQAQLA
jgi:stearoyl-CoA desaturase (delta-9 desaturase)